MKIRGRKKILRRRGRNLRASLRPRKLAERNLIVLPLRIIRFSISK